MVHTLEGYCHPLRSKVAACSDVNWPAVVSEPNYSLRLLYLVRISGPLPNWAEVRPKPPDYEFDQRIAW